MSASDPVERVVAYLEGHGFRRLPGPLMINRTRFRFPAVLVGPERSSDLVLVADTVGEEKDSDIVRQVQGVARALDIARSSNPVTTVIVGPRPNQDRLSAMMEVCRVLPLGSIAREGAASDAILNNWLAVLTPLDQIDTDGIVTDPIAALKESLDGLPEEISALADEAVLGAGAVENALNELLTAHLDAGLEKEE